MRHTIESLDESALTGRRFFLLFLLLLTTLILYPYADATVFGYYAFRVIGSSAILISVYAANFRRSLLIFVLVLAVPALIQFVGDRANGAPTASKSETQLRPLQSSGQKRKRLDRFCYPFSATPMVVFARLSPIASLVS